jgi:hypothetical protein
MPRKGLSRRKGSNRQPVAVITVPTLIRPTYSVPVAFDITTSTDVVLPGSLVGHSLRVTSIRFSACAQSSNIGTVTFALHNGVGSVSASIAAQSRQIPVTSSLTEISFRNSRHVQHTIGQGNMALVTFGLSNSRCIGVVMVSVIGVF